ncbi:MAG: DUF4249 domain-containing protein [Bacteroidia bacterium]|nr:DUF4249 domain-containing protein [Bacteroidia bacterium]
MNKRLILLIFMVLISCTKDAKIKLPKTNPVPVVYSYISPQDKEISAKVYWSIPFFVESGTSGNFGDVVNNATVFISDFSSQALLPFSAQKDAYYLPTASFPILPGKTYQLKVIMPDGRTALAETTVPEDLVSAEGLEKENFTDKYGSGIFLKSWFYDVKGKKNYYRTLMEMGTKSHQNPNDTLFFSIGLGQILTDHTNDGGHYVFKEKNYTNGQDTFIYRVSLLNCSYDYFRFHQTMKIHYDPDNPFAEPLLIYTNVKGGLGCFGAYTITRKIFH